MKHAALLATVLATFNSGCSAQHGTAAPPPHIPAIRPYMGVIDAPAAATEVIPSWDAHATTRFGAHSSGSVDAPRSAQPSRLREVTECWRCR